MRITKRKWYALGGFKNSDCCRKHNGKHWEYYYIGLEVNTPLHRF